MTARSNAATAAALVGLLVLGAVAGAWGGAVETASAAQPSTDSYVVEQGEFCEPIEPLSTDGSVEAFYDYRNHETHSEGDDRMYSSYGTTHFQEDNTSVLFLHEGTDGTSLGVVHDRVDGETTGGVATFDVVGVPHDAEWAVRDDDYDGPTNMDEFDTGDGWAGASWIWIENRTGGGAINGGLNDAFAVTVHPAFNEDAEYYENDDLYDPDWYDGGEIDDLAVATGDAEDPETVSLPSLGDPVTVRTGTCDDPAVTYDRTDDGIEAGVSGAAADDHLVFQPTSGSDDGVRFERIETTGLEGDATVAFENRRPDGVSGAPDGGEALSYLTVRAEPSPENASATVSFAVDADRLDDAGVDPSNLALYERDGDEWRESSTTLLEDRGGVYRYEAEVASLDGFAVAPAPDAGEGASPTDGFAAITAVGAVLLAAGLWAARGRRR